MNQYAPRPKKQERTWKCYCGHDYLDHDQMTLKSFFVELFSKLWSAGKCDKCMCSKYEQAPYLETVKTQDDIETIARQQICFDGKHTCMICLKFTDSDASIVEKHIINGHSRILALIAKEQD